MLYIIMCAASVAIVWLTAHYPNIKELYSPNKKHYSEQLDSHLQHWRELFDSLEHTKSLYETQEVLDQMEYHMNCAQGYYELLNPKEIK